MVYISSVKEINYNLQIMEEAFRKNPNIEIDTGFEQIFQADIDVLKKTNTNIDTNAVSTRLNIIAKNIFRKNQERRTNQSENSTDKSSYSYDTYKKERQGQNVEFQKRRPTAHPPSTQDFDFENFFKPVSPSLVGKKEAINEAILQNYGGDRKVGLEFIGSRYDRYKIRGDGHCFFRAFAFILLQFYSTQFRERMKSQKILEASEYQKLQQALRDLEYKKTTAHEILNHQELSDLLVQLLRSCVADTIPNMAEKNEDFRKTLEGELDGPFIKEYCNEMRQMDARKYGGEPELMALKEYFGLKGNNEPQLFDADQMGNKPKLPNNFFPALLRIGDHYDVLVRKIAL